jgi:hypothetical protein
MRSKHPSVELEDEALGSVTEQTEQSLREINRVSADREQERVIQGQYELLRQVINQKKVNEALARLITRRNLPHNMVEWPEFRAFCAVLNPESLDFISQSHSSVPRLIARSYRAHQIRLREVLAEAQSVIHFNVDVWSSPNKKGLLAVTARFVHENKIKKALLALPELGVSHRGEVLSEEFLEAMQFYGIVNKLGYITCDNGSSNDTMVRSISKTAASHGIHWNESWRRIRCAGHVINLAVQAFLFANSQSAVQQAVDRVKEVGVEIDEIFIEKEDGIAFSKIPPLNTLHKLAVAIRSSTQRYRQFSDLAGRSLPQDNDTRWNSWYIMLKAACQLHTNFSNHFLRW